MKHFLSTILDRICGQPDLLRNSRSLALKQILSIPAEKPKRPPVVVGERIEA